MEKLTCPARTYLKINVYLSEGTAWPVPSSSSRDSEKVTFLIQAGSTSQSWKLCHSQLSPSKRKLYPSESLALI